MKFLLLAFLLFSLGSAYAIDICHIQNAGVNTYVFACDGGDVYLNPGQSIKLPASSYWAFVYDFENVNVGDFEMFFDTPYVVISDSIPGYLAFGEFPTLYGTTGQIAEGFSFGLALWAICAGIVWSMKILKTFASGAT